MLTSVVELSAMVGEMCAESWASGPKHLLKNCSNTMAGT